MAYDLAKVTTNGNNLIAQILANKSSLSIDKIEISDTQLPSTTDISTMTSVPKVVQTVSANGFSKNSNTLIVSTVVDNSSIRADYKAWVFGIWGSDSQNGQSQLIAVITSTNSPDTIPAFSGRTPVSYTYKFNIGFSNASQIKFNMINGSFATNDTVVHTTGNETINGKKKFDTDPTDGAGNAYAKTVDVNQQLDKKVNVSDMRKPARDVAGIEEVNTKQDKIGYKPADDSKVVHDNHDGTEQLNGVQVQPFNKLSDTIGGRNLVKDSKQEFTGKAYDFHDYNLASITELAPGKTYTMSFSAKVDDKAVNCNQNIFVDISNSSWLFERRIVVPISTDYQRGTYSFTIPKGQTGVNVISVYLQHPVINGKLDSSADKSDAAGTGYIKELKLEEGSIATDWTPAPEDKVNVSDMRKPASDVAGIDEVNTKQDKIGYTPADDSKVVHNSGTEEIAGQKTFDTAPIDKTTGHPYITKDGVPAVPSTLADTTKLANFTAGLQSGGVSVATSDDLKSVENSAWCQLKEGEQLGGTLLYKIDQNSKRIYILYAANWDDPIDTKALIADFSSIVKNIETISVIMYFQSSSGGGSEGWSALSIDSPALIVLSNSLFVDQNSHLGFSDGAYFTYDDLQDAYK